MARFRFLIVAICWLLMLQSLAAAQPDSNYSESVDRWVSHRSLTRPNAYRKASSRMRPNPADIRRAFETLPPAIRRNIQEGGLSFEQLKQLINALPKDKQGNPTIPGMENTTQNAVKDAMNWLRNRPEDSLNAGHDSVDQEQLKALLESYIDRNEYLNPSDRSSNTQSNHKPLANDFDWQRFANDEELVRRLEHLRQIYGSAEATPYGGNRSTHLGDSDMNQLIRKLAPMLDNHLGRQLSSANLRRQQKRNREAPELWTAPGPLPQPPRSPQKRPISNKPRTSVTRTSNTSRPETKPQPNRTRSQNRDASLNSDILASLMDAVNTAGTDWISTASKPPSERSTANSPARRKRMASTPNQKESMWTTWNRRLNSKSSQLSRQLQRGASKPERQSSRSTARGNGTSLGGSNSAGGTASSTSRKVSGGWWIAVCGVVLAVGVIGIGLAVITATQQVAPKDMLKPVREITDGESLLLACHQLAWQRHGRPSCYWNHKQLFTNLANHTDARGEAADIQKLAEIYGRTRYAPRGIDLSTEQSRQANQLFQALRRELVQA